MGLNGLDYFVPDWMDYLDEDDFSSTQLDRRFIDGLDDNEIQILAKAIGFKNETGITCESVPHGSKSHQFCNALRDYIMHRTQYTTDDKLKELTELMQSAQKELAYG